jgi:cell wall-associated NlpC family hydrolase
MRRLGLIVSVAGLATLLVSIATLAAAAETKTRESTEPSGPDLSISQGTATGASQSELNAVRRDMAQEESLPDYSQVVDNANSGGRLDAQGWKRGGTDGLAHGGDYVSAGPDTPGAKDARFKLKTPTDGDYALYAWWPARKGNATAARFGVKTASGTKWTEVDQTKDGGTWVKLGNYEMKAGDGYVVRISPKAGPGEVVADAVALVRGIASPPPDDLAPAEGGLANGGGSGDNVYNASSTLRERWALIRQGRKHLGTPYRLSPPAPCRAYRSEDCSCFTKLVFRHFGKRLVDNPVRLYWRKNRKWVAKRNLKRGDLVFFKEHGWNRPITHVGMYSGHGNLLHASSYFGKVVESKMKYIKGYFGARRVRKLN